MVYRETLKDGSLRLRSEHCTFVYTRLRPGVVLTTISGHDRGELGDAPLREIGAEFARFGQPVEWFVDTKNTFNAVDNVSDAWTAWFQENRAWLKRVSILVTSKPVHLTVSIARHLSGTSGLMEIYSEVGAFEKAIARDVPEFRSLPAGDRSEEPSGLIERETLPDGAFRLSSEGCTFLYRTLKPDLLLVTISGHDRGQFGSEPLDAIAARFPAAGALDLFVDTRDTARAAVKVSEEWTAWFLANRPRLKQVGILVGSKPMEVTVGIAKHMSRTGELIKIYPAPAQFEEAVARHSPGFKLAPGR